MLVLSRKVGDAVELELNGVKVVATVVEVRGDKVRLGFEAPPEVSVDRLEVFDAKYPGRLAGVR